MSRKPIRLLLVAPDGCLARSIRIADRDGWFQTVRFRSLANAVEKGKNDPASVLLVECPFETSSFTELNAAVELFSPRCFVFAPDLSKRTVREAEAFRFSLLQYGATAVFSRLQELPVLLSAFERCVAGIQAAPKDLTRAIQDTLPWDGF